MRENRSEEKWWFAFGGVEGSYDTNPLSVGTGPIVPSTASTENRGAIQPHVGVGARIVNRPDLFWAVQAREQHKWYDDIPEFEQNDLSLSTFAEWWPNEEWGMAGSLGGAFSTWMETIPWIRLGHG
jgi:hypothetical protein